MQVLRPSRRHFLALSGGMLALPLLGNTVALGGPQASRLIVVNLRGGMDGLGAIAPYDDPAYRSIRGALALNGPGEPDGVGDLDGFFGLHPRLATLHDLYRARELISVIGVACPYRTRSHFDAQDALANGTTGPSGREGWLSRALAETDSHAELSAIAVGTLVPLLLRGKAPVTSVMPSNTEGQLAEPFLAVLDRLYAADPDLATTWSAGRSLETMTGEGEGSRIHAFEAACALAAKFLNEPIGPRVISLELSGWDTHAGQGAAKGRLAVQLGYLDRGIARLRADLAPDVWQRTVIVVVSEFGRTVRINGTGGTDHGTAGAAFIIGGAVNGGKVLHDWRGLKPEMLYENRDLYPSIDVRALFKSMLRDHMKIGPEALDTRIFPESSGVPPLSGLVSL